MIKPDNNKKITKQKKKELLDFEVVPSGYLATTYFPAFAVSSALEVLTSVFGMGTGGTPPVWSPDYVFSFPELNTFLGALFLHNCTTSAASNLRSRPRPISTGPLHMSPCFHSRPIYLLIFQGSYQITLWEISS